ncbi:MAG TPA: type II toxin-antitoxin system RelE/ParE family toxin [Terracidiphilus sp.]
MIDVREYIDEAGKSPSGKWFDGLNGPAAAKVATALERITQGNFSSVEPAGAGVLEYKIDWGPGYRIYFGKDGKTLVILVGGGIKKRHSSDIKAAKAHWADYKKRKK